MTRYWFSQWIASNPDYHLHNGRPVLFFWSPESFLQPAGIFGTSVRATTDLIRSTAAEFGFAGSSQPFLVAVSVGDAYISSLAAWGFDAYSPYVYSPGSNGFQEGVAGSGFAQIKDIYQNNRWNSDLYYAQNQGIKYFVPNLARHDGRPWAILPAYWNPAPMQFDSLVRASMAFALAHSAQTDKTLMTCCWNEWGEGNFMERTSRAPSQDRGGTSFSDEHRHTIVGGVNQPTGGNIDGLTTATTLEGWAIDPDIPNQRVTVQIYMTPNMPHPPSLLVGSIPTTKYRGDVNSYLGGVQGTHGFAYELPRICYRSWVTVRVLDSSGNGDNLPLGSNGAGGLYYGPNC